MAQGENDSTWGTKTNTNLNIIESGIGGVAAVSTTGGTSTLADVDYTADDGKKCVIDVTGTLVSNATVEIPNRTKTFKVFNRTTGAYTLTIKTSGGSGIEVTQSSVAEIYCDGSNTVRFVTAITDYATGAPNTAGGASASTISLAPSGDLTSTNVQSGMVELQGDIDAIEADLLANYQPLDSELTTLAGLSETTGNLIVGTSGAWAALGVGANGYVLVADTGSAAGMKWAALVPQGTRTIFYQANAPTGWTVDSGVNEHAIRLVSGGGTGGNTAGTTNFSSILTSRTLTADQIPAHTHPFSATTSSNGAHTHTYTRRPTGLRGSSGLSTAINGTQNQTTSSDGAHTHTVSGTSGNAGSGNPIDFAIKYADFIMASKDAY